MAITVPYRVLADGYKISGDASSGYKATVAYIVAFADAFTFVNETVGRTEAVAVGPVTYYLPYRLPTTGGVGLYAQAFEIEPWGASDGPVPNKGLIPGSDYFWTDAKVTLTFGQMPSLFQGEDPNRLNQLDPSEPITCATQSVRSRGKILTRKGSGYKFSDGKTLLGDFGERTTEADIVVDYPKVPFLPWKIVKDTYLNRVNTTTIWSCPRGTLLLEGIDTRTEKQSDGTLAQAVTLTFKSQEYDWNKQPRPDNGALDDVSYKGSGNPIYPYVEFRNLLNSLKYTAVAS